MSTHVKVERNDQVVNSSETEAQLPRFLDHQLLSSFGDLIQSVLVEEDLVEKGYHVHLHTYASRRNREPLHTQGVKTAPEREGLSSRVAPGQWSPLGKPYQAQQIDPRSRSPEDLPKSAHRPLSRAAMKLK